MPVTKLTNTTVASTVCPPDKKKITLFDDALTGFICEIGRTGRRTYALRYTDERGKQCQYKLGDASVLTADQARKAAQRLKARTLIGDNPQTERKIKRQVPTLSELAPRYLHHVRGYKRAPDIDERYLRLHLLPRFGGYHLDELKQAEIVDWLNSKVKAGYAQATVNRWHVILSHMLRLAGEWGVPGAERNPLKGAKLKDPNNKKERFLTAEEIARLRVAVEASANPMLAPIVALLLLTGCRKRELLDATWEQFDIERKSWRIPMSKSGKARYVPLSDEATKVLDALPRIPGCPYVVPNLRTKKPHSSIFNAWNTARRKAGLSDARLHDCRHTLASHLAMSGHSLLVISKVLGHNSTRTTERYAHVSNDSCVMQLISPQRLAAPLGYPPSNKTFPDRHARSGNPFRFFPILIRLPLGKWQHLRIKLSLAPDRLNGSPCYTRTFSARPAEPQIDRNWAESGQTALGSKAHDSGRSQFKTR